MGNSYFILNGCHLLLQATKGSICLFFLNSGITGLCFSTALPSSFAHQFFFSLHSPRAATSLYGIFVKLEQDANALGVCDPVPGYLASRVVSWLDFRGPQLPQRGSTTCTAVRLCSPVPISCHIKALRQTEDEQAATQAPCTPLPSP